MNFLLNLIFTKNFFMNIKAWSKVFSCYLSTDLNREEVRKKITISKNIIFVRPCENESYCGIIYLEKPKDGTHIFFLMSCLDEQGIENEFDVYLLLHHDDDIPAMDAYGFKQFFKNGITHRDGDLPAIIRQDGSADYYKNGLLYRHGDMPSIIRWDGCVDCYKNPFLY